MGQFQAIAKARVIELHGNVMGDSHYRVLLLRLIRNYRKSHHPGHKGHPYVTTRQPRHNFRWIQA